MTETQIDILEIKEMLKSMQKDIQTMMNAIEHDEKYRPIEEYCDNLYDIHYAPSTQACNIDEKDL